MDNIYVIRLFTQKGSANARLMVMEAKSVADAMKKVDKEWYAGAFSCPGFSIEEATDVHVGAISRTSL